MSARKRAIDMRGAPSLPERITPFVVHWPSGPVECCREHAQQILYLAEVMGVHAPVSANPDHSNPCANCENELAKMHDNDRINIHTDDNTEPTTPTDQ